jgi:hypothetical protein
MAPLSEKPEERMSSPKYTPVENTMTPQNRTCCGAQNSKWKSTRVKALTSRPVQVETLLVMLPWRASWRKSQKVGNMDICLFLIILLHNDSACHILLSHGIPV